jgi:tRNA(Ile)-lysidine synthase
MFLNFVYNVHTMQLIRKLQSGLKNIPPFKKAVVAVSGGVDSIVLAYGLKALGYEVVIAHLNHKLRGAESDGDQKFVGDLAKRLGVQFVTKTTDIPKNGNLEENARIIRYEFLEDARKKYKADFIAVAHHLDDQIETVLMHMARGAGLRGQVGMQYQNGNIIRPLLGIKRQEILDYAGEQKLEYRTDSSNGDLSYDRNFWRHMVIPYLKNNIHRLGERIMKISATAKKQLESISKKADAWARKNISENTFGCEAFNKLDIELKSETLIKLIGPKDLYASALNELIDLIEAGHSGRKMVVKNLTFIIEHGNVFVSGQQEKTELPKTKITVSGIKWGQWKIKSKGGKTLFVRQWKAGDRFIPSGMKGSKKLQDFFTDKKIPLHERGQIPVIVDENDVIISVGNLRFAQGAENSIQIINH